MAIKITYFVHGTTTDNEKNVSSGWYDAELSELGIKQSIELKDYIKNKHFDIVFCSDLKRAVHSTELTFKDEVRIIQDKRLRECNYGKFNAKPSEIVEPLQEECITKRFPEGESYEDVKKRINDFLEFLKKNYDGKSVAIVAHKAPQLALNVLLKNKTWAEAFTEDWRKKGAWQPGWEYTICDNPVKSAVKKGGYIMICPKCKSVDVHRDNSNPLQPAMGLPAMYICNKCKHGGYSFPEINLSEIKEFEKEANKNNFPDTKKDDSIPIDTSYGNFKVRYFWKISAPVILLMGVYLLFKEPIFGAILTIIGMLMSYITYFKIRKQKN